MPNTIGRAYAPVSGYTSKKSYDIEYQLTPEEKAATFQIKYQSDRLTAWLLSQPKSCFMASNGVRIAISDFPEWQESQNVIFLRGIKSVDDEKLDTTRFISNVNRDRKIAAFDVAMKEFVNQMKKELVNNYHLNGMHDSLAYLVDMVNANVRIIKF